MAKIGDYKDNTSFTFNTRAYTQRTTSRGTKVYDAAASGGGIGGGFSGVAAVLGSTTSIGSSWSAKYQVAPFTTDPLNFPILGVHSTGTVWKNQSSVAVLMSLLTRSNLDETYVGRVASFNTSGYGTAGTYRDISHHLGTTSWSTANRTARFVIIAPGQTFLGESTKPDTASKGFNASGASVCWAITHSISDVTADQIKAAMDAGTLSTLLQANNITNTSISSL